MLTFFSSLAHAEQPQDLPSLLPEGYFGFFPPPRESVKVTIYRASNDEV